HRVEDILRVAVELGLDPLPSVFTVADGFLLMLPVPSEKSVVGAIRLRGLSKHLLIPVNAELIPPLLEDESSALVSKRGLVFLPDSRVLEFDPTQPIDVTSLVQIGPVRRPPWQSLPQAPVLAESITQMTMVGVATNVDQIIDQGGDGIGTEADSPESDGGMS